MTIKPLDNKVLVRLEKKEEKTASGIYIPTQSQTSSLYGEVVAIGSDVNKEISVGVTVLLDKFSTKMSLEDGLTIVSDDEILAIVSK